MERKQSLINLKMMIENHSYNISTFASCANVTTDLLQAALDGQEELTREELRELSRFMGVPVGILTCPHVVFLKNNHYKHMKMLEENNRKLRFVIKSADKGSEYGQEYCKYHCWNYEKNESMFYTRLMAGEPVSYAQYWLSLWDLDECIDIILSEQRSRKARGRSAELKEGGAV